jgi:signal peptidase I
MTELNNLPCNAAAFASLGVEVLQLGKSLRFRAHGTSMQPLVRDGDLLLVEPVDANQLRVGDVVFCITHPGHILVHRVVRRFTGREGSSFLVQGDNVTSPDGLIPQAQVYGRVAGIERAGMCIFMNRPAMRLLGWLAVQRSRWQPGRNRWFRHAGRLARQLPILSTYLS